MDVLILQSHGLLLEVSAEAAKGAFKATTVALHKRARGILKLLRAAPVALALVAVNTVDLDGLDYIPDIVGSQLAERTVIFSERTDPRTLSLLRPLQWNGLIDGGNADIAELRYALEGVAQGRRYVSPSISRQLSNAPYSFRSILSSQEELVLSVLGEGVDDIDAGRRLRLSPRTVHNHRSRIMAKLGLHHRGELIRHAVTHYYVRYTTEDTLHPGFERALVALRGAEHVVSKSSGYS